LVLAWADLDGIDLHAFSRDCFLVPFHTTFAGKSPQRFNLMALKDLINGGCRQMGVVKSLKLVLNAACT